MTDRGELALQATSTPKRRLYGIAHIPTVADGVHRLRVNDRLNQMSRTGRASRIAALSDRTRHIEWGERDAERLAEISFREWIGEDRAAIEDHWATAAEAHSSGEVCNLRVSNILWAEKLLYVTGKRGDRAVPISSVS